MAENEPVSTPAAGVSADSTAEVSTAASVSAASVESTGATAISSASGATVVTGIIVAASVGAAVIGASYKSTRRKRKLQACQNTTRSRDRCALNQRK